VDETKAEKKGRPGRRPDVAKELGQDLRRVVILTAKKLCREKSKEGAEQLLGEMHDFLFEIRKSALEAQILSRLRLTRQDVISRPDDFSAKTLLRAFSDPAPLNRIYLNTLYLFLKTRYSTELDATARSQSIAGDELSRLFRLQLGCPDAPPEGEVTAYSGRYELVRIFPYKPMDKMVSGELRIGLQSDGKAAPTPLSCAYDYRYDNGTRHEDRNLRGKLIVHGTRATILLSNEHQVYFQLYVDSRESREPGASFSGIVLTDTSGRHLASAWPFHARGLRNKEECRVGLLEPEDVSEEILDELARRNVHWDPGFSSSDPAGRKASPDKSGSHASFDAGPRPQPVPEDARNVRRSAVSANDGISRPQTTDPLRPPFATADGWDQYGRWIDIRVGQIVQRLRWIEPGEFRMGSREDELGHEEQEGPQHLVRLTRGFWLADTACTQALWEGVMGYNPSQFKNPENPVETVSWDNAQEFLKTLEKSLPGSRAVLPSEAEWEYACRAGTETPFSFGNTIDVHQANFKATHPYADGPKGMWRQHTVAVRNFPANQWGLYQMHGNVWEWCADDLRTYGEAAATDPRGPVPDDPDANRVVRGGSWRTEGRRIRSAYRIVGYRGKRYSFHGFRFVLRC
jgi:formylglycine-generating enzyme required for sulfatase activity